MPAPPPRRHRAAIIFCPTLVFHMPSQKVIYRAADVRCRKVFGLHQVATKEQHFEAFSRVLKQIDTGRRNTATVVDRHLSRVGCLAPALYFRSACILCLTLGMSRDHQSWVPSAGTLPSMSELDDAPVMAWPVEST